MINFHNFQFKLQFPKPDKNPRNYQKPEPADKGRQHDFVRFNRAEVNHHNTENEHQQRANGQNTLFVHGLLFLRFSQM